MKNSVLKNCRSAAQIWKALVANLYTSGKLLRPLLKRLQDEDPKAEVTSRRRSTSQMPMAVSFSLLDCFEWELDGAGGFLLGGGCILISGPSCEHLLCMQKGPSISMSGSPSPETLDSHC